MSNTLAKCYDRKNCKEVQSKMENKNKCKFCGVVIGDEVSNVCVKCIPKTLSRKDHLISNNPIRQEHDAWVRMFNKMVEVLGLSREELNNKKYRPIFAEIERWAWFNQQRIEHLKEIGEWNDEWEGKGTFWDGDNG